MFVLLGKTFYWPGERSLRTQIDLAREEAGSLREKVAEEKRGRAADVARLTDAVLKAKGIYAGPLAGFAPADGTGFKLGDDVVISYDIRRSAPDAGFGAGLIRLTADVEALEANLHALAGAHHIEWEGIKWIARSFSGREGGAKYLGERGRTIIQLQLEAFVERIAPGKV